MNLAGIDLNLLVVFDALMTERHVTRAGERIGLSQPAVSKALNRLRLQFRDELFVRAPSGMTPTPRAVELAGPINEALRHLETALDPAEFDPLQEKRVFTVITNDLVASAMWPDIIGYLDKHAPGIDVRLLPSTGRAYDAMDRQEADFAMIPVGQVPGRFESVTIWNEAFVILMRRDHPLANQELTIEKFITARHVLMSLRGDDRSVVDTILEERGLSRRVGVTVNQFQSGPPIVARSDLIMLVPASLARKQAPLYDLVMKDVPFELPTMFGEMRLVWPRRETNNPASAWMRRVVMEHTGHTSNYQNE